MKKRLKKYLSMMLFGIALMVVLTVIGWADRVVYIVIIGAVIINIIYSELVSAEK